MLKEGDRARLKSDRSATGTIDEIFEGEASIVWDISGCVGEGPVEDLEPILETNECAASGAGCSYVATRKGVMCEYCGGAAPKNAVSIGKVAHIVGDGYRGQSSALLATLLVGALAASGSMAEVPRRTTRPMAIPETYEERLRREAREQQPKIDRAEAKRQRKAEKLRRRGRL